MAGLDQVLVVVTLTAGVLILYQTVKFYVGKSDDSFWASFPTVGFHTDGFFPWTRACLRSVTGTALNVAEGYQKFCVTHNLPFAVPSLGVGAIVVLPPSQFEVLNKPESQLMAFPAQMETMQPTYMMGDPDYGLFKNAIQFDVVRKHMQKDYGFFATSTAEELDDVFRHLLGVDSVLWKTVNVWDTCLKAISRTANRALIGLPLCRNEALLEQSSLYAKMVFQGATLIGALPAFLRPLLGPIVGLTSKRYAANCREILIPYIEERLNEWHTREGNDALQWIIEQCAKGGRTTVEADTIAQRLLILQLVSIYTTAYALTNIIINLYSSKQKDDFVAGIREECNRVSREHGGLSTREAIDKLYRVDSAVRESMRISPFGIITPTRIVAPGNGLILGDGIVLPPGTRVGVPFQGVHHDSRYYKNPLQYDAFRFSRKFEGSGDAGRQAEEQELNVTVSKSFLTFGYGKHVCPGRWYTSQTLKQALVYLVQNYEIEFVGEREEPGTFLNAVMPPVKTQIKVRQWAKATG
ncbi:hypothetical protein DL769_001929 [Monosporascus sp. CRB-8-3]|nr:hypothetical protein DL769_001929 [Monosporascus sp. CRB-8-3]